MTHETESGAGPAERAVRPQEGASGGALRRALRLLRAHPGTTGLVVLSTVAGAAGAVWLLGDSYTLTQRIVGGAIAGFYFSLFPLGFRLFH